MEDINALDEVHKGSCMGLDAINVLLEKELDTNLEKELKREQKEYLKINKEIERIYSKYDDGTPHETNVLTKTMTRFDLDMKTLTDKSTSKYAEILLQGVNMGIIEGRKILNNKPLNTEVKEILNNYVLMQEKSVEILKQYL